MIVDVIERKSRMADSKCLHDTNEMKSFWRAGAP